MSPQRYRLEFIVKAEDWQAVTEVFKDEFDIDSDKQDASYRKIDGIFIVQVWISADRLSSNFYNKVNESNSVALSYDPSNVQIRNVIMDRVCIVEHGLRKLLLNVSDIVEDYFKIYDKTNAAKVYGKNRDTVRRGDINPITSHLTLEDEIRIFSIELSPWHEKPLTAASLLELLGTSNELDEIKNTLHQKTTSHTVWDDVDEHILKTGKKWTDILPVLAEIKDIRNKAAHFRIVTQSDLERVKTLSLSLRDIITPKRTSTERDLQELHRSINEKLGSIFALDLKLSELTRGINGLQMEQMRSITESALAAQKAILENTNLTTGILSSAKASESITKRFSEGNILRSIIKAQTTAFSSLPKIDFPIINPPQSSLDPIIRARNALIDFDLPPRGRDYTDFDGADLASDHERSGSDNERPLGPSPDDTKGERK